MAMAALVASMASTQITTTRLQSSFRGEKLALTTSHSSPCSLALRPPQRLQVEAMKKIRGKVVCASNDKTVSVEVIRLYIHPKYKKRIRSSKKYHAHDEENRCQVGDTVILTGSRPISKTKKFVVSEIVPKNKLIEGELPPLESSISTSS